MRHACSAQGNSDLITRLANALRRAKKASHRGLRFDRPLVLLQSDDWGRVGVRDRDGWDELCAAGLNLGEKPYDSYSLETAADLAALAELLAKHSDSAGRHPSIVMNFIVANVDFERCLESGPKQVPLRMLTEGLPGKWHRPGLMEAYRHGIRERLFYPALHGLTHFCETAVARELTSGGERAARIKQLWRAQTPYIHWRMPWIGYEYWDPEKRPAERFLTADDQRSAIRRAARTFAELFGAAPFSACAPGYRANGDTARAWSENGVRVVQNGPGDRIEPYLDETGMLFTFRALEMEPAIEPCDVARLVARANQCFAKGAPAIVSVHSINFHSAIEDFRTSTLELLDAFLTALERKWPDLMYVNDADLFSIATQGSYAGEAGTIKVGVISAGAKN
jgi:hypothetical protein